MKPKLPIPAEEQSVGILSRKEQVYLATRVRVLSGHEQYMYCLYEKANLRKKGMVNMRLRRCLRRRAKMSAQARGAIPG